MPNELDKQSPRPLGRIAIGKNSRAEKSLTGGVAFERPRADIAIVFDTTGSMSDKIDGLVQIMVDFVRELSTLSLAWRITCVPFGDLTVGDRIITDRPWVAQRLQAEAMLREMPRFNGGGNTGESSLEALLAGANREWRQGSVRCIVFLTDEPALTHHVHPAEVLAELQKREIATFVLSPNHSYYQDFARGTSGTWYDIFSPHRPDELLALLRQLAADVARTAEAVHRLAGGSLTRYRLLGSGQNK